MSKKKYYAVRKGHNIGIYMTWDECKAQVNGFSGAEYKSFTNLEDAHEYMNVQKKKLIQVLWLMSMGHLTRKHLLLDMD